MLAVSGVTSEMVSTAYGYDQDSRICAIYYGSGSAGLSAPNCNTVTGPTIGNLTYAYDADGRLIDQGGTMARSNVTSPFTASYTPTNQVQTWNTGSGPVSAVSDDNSDLTTDPPTA